MGQGFDSDRPHKGRESVSRLPPVAPPPRKVGGGGSIPEMSVFRGLAGSSSAPQGSFGPLPSVSAPPTRPGSQPHIVPPAAASRRSREGLADSITRVNGAHPAPDTVKQASPSLDEQTTPGVIEEVEALDWDEEEESTHVFRSEHPPPGYGQPAPSSRPRHTNGDARVATARGLGNAPPAPAQPSRPYQAQPPSMPGSFSPAALSAAPSTDTLRLDQHEPSSSSRVVEARAVSASPVRMTPSGTPPPMFPPPPPIPSITQARPIEQSAPGINLNAAAATDEVVRDQPFVRLPSGNPYTATELGIRKPSLPTGFGSVVQPLPQAPSSDPKKWLLGAAGAAALLSIAGLAAFLFTRRPGGLQVEVRDASGASVPKAEVFVDGKRVCDASPCVVRDLEVGRHIVSVSTPNDDSLEPQNVEVVAGQTTPVTMTLKPSLATLVAASDQTGLRISVDGVDKGPLPARLADITPGKHDIVIKGDRYKSLERSIEVKAGETLDLNLPKLTVTQGRATINVKTEGVSIVLVRNDETSKAKKLEGPFPRLVDVNTGSGTWKLVASKKGLPDFVAVLDFSDGVAEKDITVEIKDDKVIDVASLPDPGPAPTSPSTPSTPTKGPAPDRPADPKPADPPAETASGMGTLNINSIPASRVLLDGQPLGETPRTGIQVTAGTHTVTFIHPELPKKSISVKVGAGETKTASAKLRTD